MKHLVNCLLLLLVMGCATKSAPVLYKNGVEYVPRQLGLGEHVSFRFVERWRIKFSWISGRPEINPCSFGVNPFKGMAEYGDLSLEDNAPEWVWRGAIVGPNIGVGKFFPGKLRLLLSGNPEAPNDVVTLGYKQAEGGRKYINRCDAYLSDSFTSAAATIVNATGYSDFHSVIQQAKNVQVGNNIWKVIVNPLGDFEGMKYGNQPLLERWVLALPETDYWLIFSFYASKQFSYVQRPVDYDRAHDLFRKSIASVSLEPIVPLVDQQKIIIPEQCVPSNQRLTWTCLFNKESLLPRTK